MTNVRDDIRHFIVETFLFGQDQGLEDGAPLLENGVIDSTGVLELVAHVEQTYGIKVDNDELVPDNFNSIDAVVSYLARKAGRAELGA